MQVDGPTEVLALVYDWGYLCLELTVFLCGYFRHANALSLKGCFSCTLFVYQFLSVREEKLKKCERLECCKLCWILQTVQIRGGTDRHVH